MRTIVQEYGPIYGEPVNGTVQGRPNGSVYVPNSNTIEVDCPEDKRYVNYFTTGGGQVLLLIADSAGNVVRNYRNGFLVVATSQDLSSYAQIQFYSDAELTTLAGTLDNTAGQFNFTMNGANENIDENLQDGDTVYLRVQLMNNGAAVATSNVIEMEVVIP